MSCNSQVFPKLATGNSLKLATLFFDITSLTVGFLPYFLAQPAFQA